MGVRKIEIDGRPFFFREGTSDETILAITLGKDQSKREYFFPNNLQDVNIIFDIGANIGVISILLSNMYPNAKVHAFEPEIDNFDLLSKNTEWNKNIVCHNIGLANENSIKPLRQSDDPKNFGGYSVYEEGTNGVSQMAKFETPDHFLNKHYITHADLIKIDCEGSEYDILTSMDLSKTKWIEGELHGMKDFELLAHLGKNFELNFAKLLKQRTWNFRALNKTVSLL